MLLVAASLFFTNPAPLDMPRAEAYLVRENGLRRLEDRYNRLDLWTSRAVTGRWADEDGRVFTLAVLAVAPPSVGADETVTRVGYEAETVRFDRRKAVAKSGPQAVAFRGAIGLLSPFEPAERGLPPRQMSRGYDDIDYWQGTNESAVVCAFLPAKSDSWRLAVWELLPEDDFAECLKTFEREFLEAEYFDFVERHPGAEMLPVKSGKGRSERESLRRDARHSVAAYDGWRVSDADEFTVLDDLPANGEFVATLTNELATFRRKYAAAVPTPIDGTNVLCVARIFADRGEYLDALAVDGLTNMAWTAAYWSPARRELVAHLPSKGEDGLLQTFRHEAFHQYLSYATSMMPVSPWLNEGYAQYFENEESRDWELEQTPGPEDLDRLSTALPALFGMDYAEFYAGTDRERRMKYRLAWSVAVFIEKGAREVRHDPFKTLKADYVEALFETHDMLKATNAAFASKERLQLFVSEWLRFWKER
jgi:hypothetical protein